MSRVAIDDFGDKEIARVYLASRLDEAKLVEAELQKHNIDYAVEVESYLTATFLFWIKEYKGAAFYVISGQLGFCREVLREAKLTSGLLEEEFQ